MHKPVDVYIGITIRCNIRCRHCNLWRTVSWKPGPSSFFLRMCNGLAQMVLSPVSLKPHKEELPYKEWIRILSDLKDWLGPYRLSITGGEPFIREDLVDIIHFCHENQIKAIVNTNATLLSPQLIKTLSDIPTLTLNISLDGSTPKTHDYLRGVTGTYQKVMDVLNEFKNPARRCSIYIATILMGPNCDEIIDIVKLSHERKLADGIIFQALDHSPGLPYDKAWFDKNPLWPKGATRGRLIDAIDNLIALKENGVKISNPAEQLRKLRGYFTNPTEDSLDYCASGENNFIINPWGQVFLCWKLPPVARFPEDPGKLWDSAAAERRRKDISSCLRTCRLLNCNFKESP